MDNGLYFSRSFFVLPVTFLGKVAVIYVRSLANINLNFQKPYPLNTSFFMPVTIAQKYTLSYAYPFPGNFSWYPCIAQDNYQKRVIKGILEMSREEEKP